MARKWITAISLSAVPGWAWASDPTGLMIPLFLVIAAVVFISTVVIWPRAESCRPVNRRFLRCLPAVIFFTPVPTGLELWFPSGFALLFLISGGMEIAVRLAVALPVSAVIVFAAILLDVRLSDPMRTNADRGSQ